MTRPVTVPPDCANAVPAQNTINPHVNAAMMRGRSHRIRMVTPSAGLTADTTVRLGRKGAISTHSAVLPTP